jgi:GNAT acetyltransferase-like protein
LGSLPFSAAPLPSWLDLVCAIVRSPAEDGVLAARWCRADEVAGWLSRSAWSLALIASWRKRLASGAPITIWVPDLFCNSSLVALRAVGVRLVFYPLTDKMSPDMSACRILRETGSPDVFLLMHYFGRPAAADAAKEFCARTGAWLVEGAMHVLVPTHGIGTSGDFVLYSPHRYLPIPEGAVLVVRQNGPRRFGLAEMSCFGKPSSWVSQLRDLQRHMGCTATRSRVRTAAWLGNRVLQKLGLRHWGRQTTSYREQFNLAEVDCPTLVAPDHGGLARRLLSGLIADFGAIARYRERHELLWDALLLANEGSSKARVTATQRPSHREWTPYLASYEVDAEDAEITYLHWRRNGIPVTTWPDLPPEIRADPDQHPNAWRMRHSRMYLPVHQSLQAGVFRRFQASRAVVQDSPRLRFVWDEATPSQWKEWMAQSGRSNLLQSWAYGAAKASTSAWRVTRCVIYCAGEPIALAQVLQIRVAGILKISRINRGPLYLRSVSPGVRRAVWDELARLGSIRHGRLLTVAPEAELSGSDLLLFADKGFRQFSPLAWESVWVDLGLDLVSLRKRLDGKWRNMLSFSERTALQLDIGRDDQSFEWMIAQYRKNMQDKNFLGPSVQLLRSLQGHLDMEMRPIILRALVAGDAVAGICLIPHGVSVTYLLGWNGSVGRNLKANQYLLWQAIVHLKQSGFRWFDLCGVSEEATPGISAFKLGLNGERYESVGEFWKW